jgi:glucan phosphoethanolaminetransferase (alkaline phosphatase superfamily)
MLQRLLPTILLGAACSPSAPSAPPDAPNVLWVIWDTARQDHLSLYGYPRPTTPHLDAWAEDARVFTDCLST